MALLLKDRETGSGTAQPPPDGPLSATAPDFACESCGAAMARGQDWCLECGTAAPGRLGARPGWRAAFSVVGATTALLLCAVVAAYAALTGDAQRSASTPPVGSADPIVAQTPGAVAPGTVTPGAVPVQPGATGPNTAAPPATNTTPIIPARPPGPVTNIPVRPPGPVTNVPVRPPPAAASSGRDDAPGSSGAGSSASSTGSPGTSAAATPSGPAAIALAKDAAKTYDQPARPGAEFGPARFAIDDKPSTVWDVVVPADSQPINAGLVIDLGKPHALHSLRLVTTTPGFTVEVYGARSAKELPADVIDKRWIDLTEKKGVEDDTLVSLKGKGDGAKVQLLLLYFTTPGNATDPRVAIGDVMLRGTP